MASNDPGLTRVSANNVGTMCDGSSTCTGDDVPDCASDANSKGMPNMMCVSIKIPTCKCGGRATNTSLAAGSTGNVG